LSNEIKLTIAAVENTENLPGPESVKVPDTSVDILYPSPGTVALRWHTALQAAYNYDMEQGWNNIHHERSRLSGANISKARNNLVRQGLAGDAEWFLFLDTDMVIEPDTIPRLLCSAAVSGADIIGALCVYESDDGPIPTIYQYGNAAAGEVTRVMFDYPENKIIQVAATGTACLLVKRSVFEHMAELQPDNPYPWFAEQVVGQHWMSEDIMFCIRANAAGHPVFVDCTTPVGHQKGRKVLWPKDIKDELGFPKEKNVVIIPTKDRLDLLQPLIQQIRDQGETDLVIVCDNGSGKKTRNWLHSQDEIVTLDMPDTGIHEMWNAGAAYARNDGQKRNVNLIFLNNDLILGDNFVSNLTGTLRNNDKLIAVSAKYDDREIDGPYQETDRVCGAKYDGTGGFAGFAFAVRMELFTSGYSFPEECRWWYGDNDLIRTIIMGEGKVGISSDATVEHIDGGGQSGGDRTWSDPKWDDMKKNDRASFEARWTTILESVNA